MTGAAEILLERHCFRKVTGGRYSATNADISDSPYGGKSGGVKSGTESHQ